MTQTFKEYKKSAPIKYMERSSCYWVGVILIGGSLSSGFSGSEAGAVVTGGWVVCVGVTAGVIVDRRAFAVNDSFIVPMVSVIFGVEAPLSNI